MRIPRYLALWERDRTQRPVVRGELTHHSDVGSQYTAVKFTENLALQGITPSIGSVGDAYDNALMESINGLYKTECIGSRIFTPQNPESLVDVELATMVWVQWYNRHRLHSTLGMVPPTEYEESSWAGEATIPESPATVAQPRECADTSPCPGVLCFSEFLDSPTCGRKPASVMPDFPRPVLVALRIASTSAGKRASRAWVSRRAPSRRNRISV